MYNTYKVYNNGLASVLAFPRVGVGKRRGEYTK